ncbi:cytochrome P450 [Lindgomyces ingoldianus]|uniref:Cytochrome P450 n=1 Tax=Lindgomyces ingoldianus TaxID=673940 RepID=A0ACB6QVB9_9PLEO|nr:cytochrome P450 [Lindgomyces ingoldianus]KAF2470455.1 cytochrome P450 [Lindgomyces ingoldianus]
MHNSILLALWAAISFVLYKIYALAANEFHHRKRERELGCKRPPLIKGRDPIGIENIRRLLKADRECRMPQYLKERTEAVCEKEGKQLSTFYQNLLGSGAIFTVDPKNIQTVLATQFKDFGLGDARNHNFRPLLGHGIFASDGKQWEHSRALLRPQFAREQVSDLDLEERHVQNMMRCIRVNPDGWTDLTNIQSLFFRLTIDSATEFLFGESVDSQLSSLPGYSSNKPAVEIDEKEFAFAFDKAQASIAKAARFGDGYWMAHNAEFRAYCKRCHTFIDHYVNIALSKPKDPQTPASRKQKYVFLDALVESTRDPIELRMQLLNILLAGRDTTASLLSYVFMTLIEHPLIFNKLRATILEDFGTYDNPKEITFSGLKSSNYLQWVLNETLRLYPVVPLDGRRALVDTTLPTGGGPDGRSPVYVRKGEQVDYSVYVMHRRKDLWGPDADVFKPERWDGRRSGWEYLPFNGGPRICIGQQFALTEAGYVTVRLLQRFDSLVGESNSWEGVEKGGVGWVRQWVTLTSCPADGVKVRMREAKA